MTTYSLLRAMVWLNPLVHLVGGLIAFRTFLRCRKNGYLVVAFYFLLATFTLAVMPSIRSALAERRKPDVSEEIERKMYVARACPSFLMACIYRAQAEKRSGKGGFFSSNTRKRCVISLSPQQ